MKSDIVWLRNNEWLYVISKWYRETISTGLWCGLMRIRDWLRWVCLSACVHRNEWMHSHRTWLDNIWLNEGVFFVTSQFLLTLSTFDYPDNCEIKFFVKMPQHLWWRHPGNKSIQNIYTLIHFWIPTLLHSYIWT